MRTSSYGVLSETLDLAAQRLEEVQDGLFIATDKDVFAFLPLIKG